MLEYTLEDNELTKTEGDMRAQVVNVRAGMIYSSDCLPDYKKN